jgi:two-component system response regulator PilR (NtrC family)
MVEAMERCAGVQTRAAELLGMTFRSFRYFAKKYGMSVRDGGGGEGEGTEAGAIPGGQEEGRWE